MVKYNIGEFLNCLNNDDITKFKKIYKTSKNRSKLRSFETENSYNLLQIAISLGAIECSKFLNEKGYHTNNQVKPFRWCGEGEFFKSIDKLKQAKAYMAVYPETKLEDFWYILFEDDDVDYMKENCSDNLKVLYNFIRLRCRIDNENNNEALEYALSCFKKYDLKFGDGIGGYCGIVDNYENEDIIGNFGNLTEDICHFGRKEIALYFINNFVYEDERAEFIIENVMKRSDIHEFHEVLYKLYGDKIFKYVEKINNFETLKFLLSKGFEFNTEIEIKDLDSLEYLIDNKIINDPDYFIDFFQNIRGDEDKVYNIVSKIVSSGIKLKMSEFIHIISMEYSYKFRRSMKLLETCIENDFISCEFNIGNYSVHKFIFKFENDLKMKVTPNKLLVDKYYELTGEVNDKNIYFATKMIELNMDISFEDKLNMDYIKKIVDSGDQCLSLLKEIIKRYENREEIFYYCVNRWEYEAIELFKDIRLNLDDETLYKSYHRNGDYPRSFFEIVLSNGISPESKFIHISCKDIDEDILERIGFKFTRDIIDLDIYYDEIHVKYGASLQAKQYDDFTLGGYQEKLIKYDNFDKFVNFNRKCILRHFNEKIYKNFTPHMVVH